MTIERNVNGIVDYCLEKVEEIDAREDLDIDKKTKYGLAYLKELRGFASLNLGYKKLMLQAPELAKNSGIVLPIGSQPKPKAIEKEETGAAKAAAR